jgi:hypothetical protein
MARRGRIQFQGAVYEVMARGDRRESIIGGDKERRMFIETVGEACGVTRPIPSNRFTRAHRNIGPSHIQIRSQCGGISAAVKTMITAGGTK